MSVSVTSVKSAIAGDLQVTRGDNITWEDTVQNIEDSVAVDITGAALTFSVKVDVEDPVALFTRTVGDGIVINADQVTNKGKYQLSLVPSNTSALKFGTYEYDIQITLSGKVGTISRGEIEIMDEVTD